MTQFPVKPANSGPAGSWTASLPRVPSQAAPMQSPWAPALAHGGAVLSSEELAELELERQREDMARQRHEIERDAQAAATMLAGLHDEMLALRERLARDAVGLAVTIAESLTRMAIAAHPEILVTAIEEMLIEQGDDVQPIVRMAKDDLERVRRRANTTLEAEHVALVADPTLAPGDFVIEAADGFVNGRWADRLATLRDRLESLLDSTRTERKSA